MERGGAYPHAFMTALVGENIEVYFRTEYVCTFPINSSDNMTLTHVYLEDGDIEYYIKGTNVYRYNHKTEETDLIVEGKL